MACGWRPGTLAGLILLVLLGGCSWMGGSDDPKKQPTRVTYSMAADSMVNPNLSGDATPVEVQVFELEDESMFHNADYEQLVHDARKGKARNSKYSTSEFRRRGYKWIKCQYKPAHDTDEPGSYVLATL